MNKTKLLFLLLICVVGLPVLGGCIAYVHSSFPIVIGSGGYGYHDYYGNPHPQYYCYECHGYRYFDPYYDYCVYYGFRFNWNTHPSLRRYYRERHDVIVRDTPNFGDYKYKSNYRQEPNYTRPPDYQSWKRSEEILLRKRDRSVVRWQGIAKREIARSATGQDTRGITG